MKLSAVRSPMRMRARGTVEPHDRLARRDRVAVGRERGEAHGRVDLAEDEPRHLEPGEHAGGARLDHRLGLERRVDARLGRDVAAADVLGEGHAHERDDAAAASAAEAVVDRAAALIAASS